MFRLAILFSAFAAPATAQVAPPVVGPAIMPPPIIAPTPAWRNPASDYITIGQDEAGYRNWFVASTKHQVAATSFNTYLTTWGVSGIVPTWQLFRTATSWNRCGAQPFEVPPLDEWPHVVQTLRYIRDYVIPAVGPVEAVSVYRNPSLNVCAGGAPESAHKHYSAVDLVPLRATTREQLMQTLCRVHARRGLDYGVGLGFYAFLRFHVDTTKYRRWGADPSVASCPPIIRPTDIATVTMPPAQVQAAAPATPAPIETPAPTAPIPTDVPAAPTSSAAVPDQAAGQSPQRR